MTRPPRLLGLAALSLGALSLSSCAALVEQFSGMALRELLVKRIQTAQVSQTEAKEQIQSTFDQFKGLTGFDGGELEAMYDKLRREYENSISAADTVRNRINSIESTSERMFAEWDSDNAKYKSESLRQRAIAQRNETHARYEVLIGKMRAAESKMQPVLDAFSDQVLFLKSNLRTAAINSLEASLAEIEGDVAALIEQMQASIDEAQDFVEKMDTTNAESAAG